MTNIAYYRVSTAQQGRSGLGLDAQRDAVRQHLGREPDREFTEIESGKKNDREQLRLALDYAELTGGTLIVAKLDRLSRDLAFLTKLQQSKVHKIVFADMPEASREMITFMSFFAQWEREQISKRTKDALRASKERGTKLGGDRGNLAEHALKGAQNSAANRSRTANERAEKLRPFIDEARRQGITSLNGIANHLNANGLKTARMNDWTHTTVKSVLERLND